MECSPFLHDMETQTDPCKDHMGIKPLYYSINRDHLGCSEIKAILANGLVERKLNVDALRIHGGNTSLERGRSSSRYSSSRRVK
jgi:asparagine synthetase B (glutamine-hydrolysing)